MSTARNAMHMKTPRSTAVCLPLEAALRNGFSSGIKRKGAGASGYDPARPPL